MLTGNPDFFCNGPRSVNPFCGVNRRGRASVRDRRKGRHLMGIMQDRSPNLGKRGLMPHPGLRPDLVHRPGEGTSLQVVKLDLLLPRSCKQSWFASFLEIDIANVRTIERCGRRVVTAASIR
jgi:hypothetical protein